MIIEGKKILSEQKKIKTLLNEEQILDKTISKWR